MNVSLFIAKKIIFNNNKKGKHINPIIKISIAAISIGVTVMLLAIAIVQGFQREIKNKVYGFEGHILITSYDSYNSLEKKAINRNKINKSELLKINGIKNIQAFALKPGIIRTKEYLEGIVLKGVDKNYNWDFLKKHLIKGHIPKYNDTISNEILISKKLSDKLKVNVNDKLIIYFIQQPARIKKFKITGLYETNLEQLDNYFIISDIKQIININSWSKNQISGFEVFVSDINNIKNISKEIYKKIPYDLNVSTIMDKYKDIFNWLELQDMNVVIIIVLMIMVSGINIISTLLIMILERTNMIGILKAIGYTNFSIQKIFIYNGIYLIAFGLIIGNCIALLLSFLQWKFHIISLPKESYYISYIPIYFNGFDILILNFGTLLLTTIMLLFPSFIISKISPVKAIRFE